MTRLTYTPAEAADALGVSTRSVYRALKAGDLPKVRVNGRVLIPVAGLEAWIERNTVRGAA